MRLWREWLPEVVAQKATEQEPQRFSAIVKGLAAEWNESHDPASTLKWLSLFTRYALSSEHRSRFLSRQLTHLHSVCTLTSLS